MDLKLAYGMHNGRLRYIDDVERGLNCGCVCPSCGRPLVARKGPVKVAHFAHHQGGDCGKGVETALHQMAKEILEHRREIVFLGRTPSDPTNLYTIEKVDLEKRLGNIVPDVTVYIAGRPILIEVVVTHDIDERKRKAIRELGISTLVIDLSDETRTIPKDELAQIVVEGTEKKRWEFNVASARKRQRQLETARRFTVISRSVPLDFGGIRLPLTTGALHVDGCPKPEARRYQGKPYADVVSDCWDCKYLVEDGTSNKAYEAEDPNLSGDARQSLLNDPEPEGYILCGWPEIAE